LRGFTPTLLTWLQQVGIIRGVLVLLARPLERSPLTQSGSPSVICSTASGGDPPIALPGDPGAGWPHCDRPIPLFPLISLTAASILTIWPCHGFFDSGRSPRQTELCPTPARQCAATRSLFVEAFAIGPVGLYRLQGMKIGDSTGTNDSVGLRPAITA
jgi:hypothetical protein